jgi:hypothetical protein
MKLDLPPYITVEQFMTKVHSQYEIGSERSKGPQRYSKMLRKSLQNLSGAQNPKNVFQITEKVHKITAKV